MANPQLENGYHSIANELSKAITYFHFDARERDVLDAIIRLTYGFHKKMRELTNVQVAEEADMCKQHVSKTLQGLIEQNVVLVEVISPRKRKLGLNKDYEQWEKLERKQRGKKRSNQSGYVTNAVTSGNQGGYIKVTKSVTSTIERKKKETLKESGSVFESLWERYPRKRGKNAVTKQAKAEIEENAADVERALNAYLDEIERRHTAEDYIMHGSTFFNGRWRDYLGAAEDTGVQPESKWKGEIVE